MIYLLIPHRAATTDDVRLFATYGAAEQVILTAARDYARKGHHYDWCNLIAYDGIDELRPVFVYTVSTPNHLHRERFPSPSP